MSLPVMSSPDFTPEGSSAADGASPGSSMPITVVLADDHKVVRSGLRVLLQSDGRFEVLGEAGSVAGTIDTVLTCRPRVLVLDLNMGGESSLEAITRLRAEVPQTQIVVLTMQENPGFARAARRRRSRPLGAVFAITAGSSPSAPPPAAWRPCSPSWRNFPPIVRPQLLFSICPPVSLTASPNA